MSIIASNISDPHSPNAVRQPVRHLGKISDIAALWLPYMLEKKELPGDAETKRYTEEAMHLLGKDTVASSLALFDSVMIERALQHAGRPVPVVVEQLIKTVADQLNCLPALTYEHVIHSNPLQTDPRIFTEPKEGRGEFFFYSVHREIEAALAETICKLRSALLRSSSSDEAVCVLEGIEALRGGMMQLIRELPPKEFNRFRPFFNNDARNLPGPSGFFSAGVYVLDAYLTGSHPDMRAFLALKAKSLQLYPATCAQQRFTGIMDIHNAHMSLHQRGDLLSEEYFPPKLRRRIASAMAEARRAHFRLCKFFLPELFVDYEKTGTAQVSGVPTFLLKPIALYEQIAAMPLRSPTEKLET